jgi:RimJ/RimL family protein N-acetyltransferase
MINDVIVRQAKPEDIPFIIEGIIEAEKSGGNTTTSCVVFDLSLLEFKDILKALLIEDIEDYDYYLSGFFIAEYNGKPIGTCGSWIEGINDLPSGMIKANMFLQNLSREKILFGNKQVRIIKDLNFPREKGTIQLEHIYVSEQFRRQGVASKIICSIVKYYKSLNPNVEKVQGILFKENYKSFNMHLKNGYVETETKTSANPDVLKVFPYPSRTLMELYGDNFTKMISK